MTQPFMASISSFRNATITTAAAVLLMIVLLLHMLYQVSCFNEAPQHATPPPDLLFEEKNRLGSIPPTCHNKCNGCNPCMAVKVPTLHSSHGRVQPGLTRTAAMEGLFLQDNSGYSNYKPLGWKCNCGDHFFNP